MILAAGAGCSWRPAAIIFGALMAAVTHAGELAVSAAPCGKTIQVRAQDVPLGEVLKRIAESAQFRLDAKVPLADRVSVNRTGAPGEVLRHLLQGKNLVMQSDPDPACNGRQRINTVWVLPSGQDVAPAENAGIAAGPEIQNPGEGELRPALPPRPRGTRKRMTEQEWRKAGDDYWAGKTKADPETGLPVPANP